MGNTTSMNQDSVRRRRTSAKTEPRAERPAASAVRAPSTAHTLRLSIDVPFLIIVSALLAFGLLMVYSASMQPSILAKGNPYYFFLNQLKWAFVGIAAATGVMYFDYRRLKMFMVPMILGILVLLIAVLIFGEERLNATRSFAGGSVQPSEFAKLAIILYLSFWLNSKKDQINQMSAGLVPLLAILGSVAGLIILQPDISATATIIILGVLLFFLAGGNLRQIVMVGAVMAGFGAIVALISKQVSQTLSNRIGAYIAGLQDPTYASDHIQRSLESIVRGGLFGVGIGRGVTKFTGLPVAHTDSIFAVIVEETGLIGATLVLLLFLAFIWRGLKISSRAPDLTGKLLASGLTLWIGMEAMLNIGVMVNIFPFLGNALPFFSAGGSSLISTIIAVGLIMSVARVSAREPLSLDGRSYGAVADLRWRDGGRRESRSRRSAGTR